MFKQYFSSKINLIEGSIITFALLWFFVNKSLSNPATPEFIINSVFLILLLTLIFFRNSGIRHAYFGFALLVLTVVSSILGYNQFVYLISSLALGLFILGLINMLLFRHDQKNE